MGTDAVNLELSCNQRVFVRFVRIWLLAGAAVFLACSLLGLYDKDPLLAITCFAGSVVFLVTARILPLLLLLPPVFLYGISFEDADHIRLVGHRLDRVVPLTRVSIRRWDFFSTIIKVEKMPEERRWFRSKSKSYVLTRFAKGYSPFVAQLTDMLNQQSRCRGDKEYQG